MPHSETPESLPPDLLALERALTARPQPAPPVELRSRVLAAVSCERSSVVVQASRLQSAGETPAAQSARNGFARFAAATAAAALLAINLSASVANDTDWRLRSTAGPDVTDVADRIRELAPDLPEPEARRQALMLRVAGGLTTAPAPAPAAGHFLSHKDLDSWEMR